jgi:hypothetical protein
MTPAMRRLGSASLARPRGTAGAPESFEEGQDVLPCLDMGRRPCKGSATGSGCRYAELRSREAGNLGRSHASRPLEPRTLSHWLTKNGRAQGPPCAAGLIGRARSRRRRCRRAEARRSVHVRSRSRLSCSSRMESAVRAAPRSESGVSVIGLPWSAYAPSPKQTSVVIVTAGLGLGGRRWMTAAPPCRPFGTHTERSATVAVAVVHGRACRRSRGGSRAGESAATGTVRCAPSGGHRPLLESRPSVVATIRDHASSRGGFL